MNPDNTATNQREKRHAVLYFSPKNSAAFKELAARIRSDGGRTTLVWSGKWKGAESILSECRAIVIEEGCENATDIQESYRRYAVDCEIHFADSDGEFSELDPAEDEGATEDEEKHDDPPTATDAVVEGENGDGDDNGTSASDGDDDGPSEDSGEAREEGTSDSERTSSD